VTEASGRVLPELTELTEFFWKSGEDRKLRFQRCSECGELRHPPSAVCPYCRSLEWTAAEVSGRGVVAGFTLNEQMWIPSFPPPYVIAIVAIEEDDRIRLTTNVVNVPAEVGTLMRLYPVPLYTAGGAGGREPSGLSTVTSQKTP